MFKKREIPGGTQRKINKYLFLVSKNNQMKSRGAKELDFGDLKLRRLIRVT